MTATLTLPDIQGGACKPHPDKQLWDDQLEHELAPNRRERHQRAIRICQDCPVRERCLAVALRDQATATHPWEFPAGVWGGVVFAPPVKAPGEVRPCARHGCDTLCSPRGGRKYCSTQCAYRADKERQRSPVANRFDLQIVQAVLDGTYRGELSGAERREIVRRAAGEWSNDRLSSVLGILPTSVMRIRHRLRGEPLPLSHGCQPVLKLVDPDEGDAA